MAKGFLSQVQQQRLAQKLSPQQIQLMKLLQVPTGSLEDRVRQELEENPALEMGLEHPESKSTTEEDSGEVNFDTGDEDTKPEKEEGDLDDYLNIDLSDYLHDEGSDAYSGYQDEEDQDEPTTIPIEMETTFQDYLKSQVGLLNLNKKENQIALQIIGNIDDDGYLRREPLSIVDDLAFNQNLIITEKEVRKLILKIQEFDPPGVCALNLQECLILQLNRYADESEEFKVAREILEENFEAFIKKHYRKIRERLKISEEALRRAVEIILKLTPKPGAPFTKGGQTSNYIVPDFFIHNDSGVLNLSLNSRNAPELHVSEGYREMLKSFDAKKVRTKKEKEAVLFIKQKIDGAKWFIDAIKQRQNTLLVTMDAIMNFQKDFFLTGQTVELKPMILKDIADLVSMDVSTISRVANSKYVQTEFGVYLLKYFFSEAMVTDTGKEVSTHEIRRILSDIVNSEHKQKPYSDEELMKLLAQKGYPIARRTVAKYREQLSIPVARLRKEI